MSEVIRLADERDEAAVLALVRQYHEFEGVSHDAETVSSALGPLLRRTDAGRVWLLEVDGRAIGYAALCFGYSIEFGGRDAFLDEMYIVPEHRGRGIGKRALEDIASRARALGARALHLEVDRTNERARRLYLATGFSSRERFHLMSRRL